ncbi:carboxypeptidase M32 [Algirhabdus cladophorae]|uniref:carboxypeptidase M32 n=1 Tax=Algirhabdus cladophorae TaxID=3377108 RepID=UPI003B8464D9
MSAYDDLMNYTRTTSALGQVAGRLGWDQETMMARGSAAQRSEEMGAMTTILHARRSAPEVGDWLAAAQPATEVETAQLAHIQRSYDRATKVPADLAAEISTVTSTAQGTWAEARASEDVAAFLPVLSQVVALKREEGSALAEDGAVYDAMIQDYEPGISEAEITQLFDRMRPRLVSLVDRIKGADQLAGITGTFDEAGQIEISNRLAAAFGYDFNRGRIDKAVHPFSSGSGNDVRITTRTSETDPFNCFYSTVHEVGHACYEQNIDQTYGLTPLGSGVSMGVHESQSRIYENQLGRSAAFCGWLHGQMTEVFGDFGVNRDAFYGAVNQVKSGFIRTESDEVQYNLHVMLRYDLERDLMNGTLDVADLEEAWNTRFEADFGFAVDRPSNGCLQDVHWSVGLFGYFPTYSLGNVYAGNLYQALTRDVPDLAGSLGRGDPSPATDWLRENLQQHGGLRAPTQTIETACGFAPTEAPLLDYLDEKFSALYRL